MTAVALCGWAAGVAGLLLGAGARRSQTRRAQHVARTCHELRGPLTAVRLGLELAARAGGLSQPRLRALDLELGRAALALDDLSGARACCLGPARGEEVDAEALLRDSVEAWRASAAAHGVELSFSWSGGGARVLGERLRLAQATGNLIANAVEHGAANATAHGGGAVEVRGRTERSTVRVEICDDGPGLSAPVARLARRRRGGRGHGLAVAGAVIAAHGGRLAAAPSERGARLVIELPALALHPRLQSDAPA